MDKGDIEISGQGEDRPTDAKHNDEGHIEHTNRQRNDQEGYLTNSNPESENKPGDTMHHQILLFCFSTAPLLPQIVADRVTLHRDNHERKLKSYNRCNDRHHNPPAK